MQKSIHIAPVLCALAFILFSCSPGGERSQPSGQTSDSARSNSAFISDCNKLLAEARRMDSTLMLQTETDIAIANRGIKAFADYANYCHNDTLSPVFLVKCAQVARAINNIPQAKVVLDKCISDYPYFKGRPAALFLLAQLYDEDTYLNNETEARRLYEEIIELYPNSDWALSAKGAIGFLGKSDEEIMRELKREKQKK